MGFLKTFECLHLKQRKKEKTITLKTVDKETKCVEEDVGGDFALLTKNFN